MNFTKALGCGLLACVPLLAGRTSASVEPDAAGARPVVIGSAGVWALVASYDYPYSLGLQYRGGPRTEWALRPGAGVMAGRDGMAFFFADVAHDFALPRRWFVTLSLAGGLFLNGDGIGARDHLEFQSGLAVSRRLKSGTRAGLAGYHVSNGGLSSPNNGSEALLLFIAMPVRRSR